MELALKIILRSKDTDVRCSRFYKIDDKYLLGDNGILIDRTGQLLWHEQWQHSILSRMIYVKSPNILITDRLAMPGPCTMNLGICGIDMNNGNYLWKYWYENSYEERMALRQGKEKINKDIRLIRFSGGIIDGDYLITNGFKIYLKTGEYELLGKKSETESAEEQILPKEVIHDTVNYRGSIKNFALPSESEKIWADKFSWYLNVMNAAGEQKILSEIKIYEIDEFFDNNLLIVGKDMKERKDSIWLLKIK